jgi:hypothetical protein
MVFYQFFIATLKNRSGIIPIYLFYFKKQIKPFLPRCCYYYYYYYYKKFNISTPAIFSQFPHSSRFTKSHPNSKFSIFLCFNRFCSNLQSVDPSSKSIGTCFKTLRTCFSLERNRPHPIVNFFSTHESRTRNRFFAKNAFETHEPFSTPWNPKFPKSTNTSLLLETLKFWNMTAAMFSEGNGDDVCFNWRRYFAIHKVYHFLASSNICLLMDVANCINKFSYFAVIEIIAL